MGQYHTIYNIDKKEYIDGHSLGCGAKLLEWGCSAIGPTTGLAVLLSNSNGRGGGDLYIRPEYDRKADKVKPLNTKQKKQQKDIDAISGRWAGDRIVVQGDYAEEGDPAFIKDLRSFKNISKLVIKALSVDKYIGEELKKGWG